ncbi:MAG: LppX_LprAFG lipoprotein, partial [Acidimicrobiales bacterium]|nr:LppX_LprAFG lipoprotein [Acidimicrobiales bacterium]
KAEGDPTWIRLTKADLAGQAARAAQFINSIRKQVDPRTTLDALGANVPDLEEVGKQTLRGAETTHLRGRVDLSDKAIAAAPASEQEGLRSAQKVFGADGYPVDVWLDADGRVRRVQYDITSGEGAAKATTTVKLDLYDFGKAPAIALPAASEIGDASTLLTTTTTSAGK